MDVSRSRHTPGLKDGASVRFEKGEKVHYRMRDGTEYDIVIKSERMKHTSGFYGYESSFPDGALCFAVEQGIIDWEGKL